MGRPFKNIKQQRFGYLIAVCLNKHHKSKKSYWKCRCDCGNSVSVALCSLTSGSTKSCGCLHKEISSNNMSILLYKHGWSKHPLYKIWNRFMTRCYNKKSTNYKHYGGRGIKVCQEWLNDPGMFINWAISNGYMKGLSIDRIDNNGDYEPDNCRFVTMKEQNRNRRSNYTVVVKGISMCLKEAWERFSLSDISYLTFRDRVTRLNWGVMKALTTPIKK